jgi:hypothetical protein
MIKKSRLHPVSVLIAGATGSGKSALALELALNANGTIINADAMQVYGELRVLSARPNRVDEAAVPHRLYGMACGSDAWSAGGWCKHAYRERHTLRVVVPFLLEAQDFILKRSLVDLPIFRRYQVISGQSGEHFLKRMDLILCAVNSNRRTQISRLILRTIVRGSCALWKFWMRRDIHFPGGTDDL